MSDNDFIELVSKVKVNTEICGLEHPATLMSRNELGEALYVRKKYAEAELEHSAVLEVRERKLGTEHVDTLQSRINLAAALSEQTKHSTAEPHFRAVLKVMEALRGPEHLDVYPCCSNLAKCLVCQGQRKLKEAIELMKRAEIGFTKALGAEHPDSVRAKFDRTGYESIEVMLRE